MRLIDADALIKKWENVHSKDMSFEMAIIGATNDLKKAPTVDAVPVKHGKWKYKPYAYEWICSCCECVVEDGKPQYNYCPNCGARMDGERKEE